MHVLQVGQRKEWVQCADEVVENKEVRQDHCRDYKTLLTLADNCSRRLNYDKQAGAQSKVEEAEVAEVLEPAVLPADIWGMCAEVP